MKRELCPLLYPVLLLIMALAVAAGCNREPSPEEILNRMKHTYSKARTFSEATSIEIVNNLKNQEEPAQHTELLFKRPNKFNFSTKTDKISGIAVSDGKRYYLYLSQNGECLEGKAPESISSFYEQTGGKGLINPVNVVYETFLLDGRFPAKGIESSLIESGREKVAGHPCYVLSLKFPTGEKQKLWIGTRDCLIWKNQIIITQATLETTINNGISARKQGQSSTDKDSHVLLMLTETMKSVELNRDIADARFACKPPEDARIVESFSQKEPSAEAKNLEGVKAPEFTLKDMEGHSVNLADFRGKVVVLDFWDSWFKPCTTDLRIMEKFHESHHDAGLTVLGITEEKDLTRVKNFMTAEKLTFSNLNDSTGDVSKIYGVDKVPRIIIINKEGVISADLTGSQTEEKIKKELVRLGIN